jgi:DNA-binding NarL/FixJ family response regulator
MTAPAALIAELVNDVYGHTANRHTPCTAAEVERIRDETIIRAEQHDNRRQNAADMIEEYDWLRSFGHPHEHIAQRLGMHREAAVRMTAEGLSAPVIADRLGLTERTVVRYRHGARYELTGIGRRRVA